MIRVLERRRYAPTCFYACQDSQRGLMATHPWARPARRCRCIHGEDYARCCLERPWQSARRWLHAHHRSNKMHYGRWRSGRRKIWKRRFFYRIRAGSRPCQSDFRAFRHLAERDLANLTSISGGQESTLTADSANNGTSDITTRDQELQYQEFCADANGGPE